MFCLKKYFVYHYQSLCVLPLILNISRQADTTKDHPELFTMTLYTISYITNIYTKEEYILRSDSLRQLTRMFLDYASHCPNLAYQW